MTKDIRIADFLNKDLRDFARYVIETRACPNIMDGMRIGARKAIYASLKGELKNKPKVKLLSLFGDALKLNYHHGDTSLQNTIRQLMSDYLFKYKPFDCLGQIGDIRNTECSVAPRYLDVKYSKYIDIFKTDSELLTLIEEEGQFNEPKYFLPIIPVSLLYRTNSPGFGFSYRSFSYTLDSIIDNCIASISTKNCELAHIDLIPEVVGIKDENFVHNRFKNNWYSVGEFSLDFKGSTLTVTDLPYDVEHVTYEEHLQTLVDSNIITGYKNLSVNDNIHYVIKFLHGGLERMYNESRWSFFKKFKLYSKLRPDTHNVIDTDCTTLLQFSSAYELIDGFVKRRLKYYELRKSITIDHLKNEIAKLNHLIKFILLVTEDKLIINKRKISDIKKDLDFHKLPYDMLSVKIEKLSKDEIEKLENKIKDTEDYLKYIESTSVEDMYLNDLIDLKRKFGEVIVQK